MSVKPLSEEDLTLWDCGKYDTIQTCEVRRLKELFAELKNKCYIGLAMDNKTMIYHHVDWKYVEELFGPLVK